MSERLTAQDFIDLLATKHGMSKKDAEAFVKEFFLLIEQGLEKDKYVKVKGLGTFKLINVDSRESIDVNTGERIQIQEYTKVSFSPDVTLRDIINKPFAHFETVVLNENAVFEDILTEETETDDSEQEEMSASEMPVEELESIASEEATISDSSSKEQDGVADNELLNASVEDVEEDEKEEKEEEGVVAIAAETPEEQNIVEEDHVSEQKESQKADVEEVISYEPSKENSLPPSTEAEIQSPIVSMEPTNAKQEKTPFSFLVGAIIVVLCICGGIIFYLYSPDFLSSSNNKENIDEPAVTQHSQPSIVATDTVKKDSAVTSSMANVREEAPKEKIKEQEKSVNPTPVSKKVSVEKEVKDNLQGPNYAGTDSSSYMITGTQTIHTVKEGETLTKIALHFYGTKALWPYIVKHNRNVIKNPDNVPYGTTIKIPELTKK